MGMFDWLWGDGGESAGGCMSFMLGGDDPDPEIPPDEDGPDVIVTAKKNGSNELPRPTRFDEFVGNREVVELLKREIAGANRFEKGRMRNVLLYGPPGTGKTTLAEIIANEQGYYLVSTTGNAIRNPFDMYKVLLELQEMTRHGLGVGMLFIDEIHELCRGQGLGESELLPLFERGIFHCPSIAGLGIEIRAPNGAFVHEVQPVLVMEQPWVAVGATTEPGMLSDAMRRRFPCECFMRPYGVADMEKIVSRYSRTLGVGVTEAAEKIIAQRARANPARVISLLQTCRNRVASEDVLGVSGPLALREMQAQGIHDNGLTQVDVRILESLRDCPVTKKGDRMGLGLSSVGDILGMSPNAVAKVWEPYLKQIGFLVVASRRKITDKGLAYLAGL
jgi:Holliday junction DNA helicase RuvB